MPGQRRRLELFEERAGGTFTHDYKRHGTTTLFAALDVASGTIHHQCLPRLRRDEFLRFMTRLERRVPKGVGLHVILDNYATHKTPKVAQWLRRHPRVHFHFTPTSASWLNLVERFFSELRTRQLRRLAVTSVTQLEAAIHRYIAPQRRSAALHLDGLGEIHPGQGPESERDSGFTTLVLT